MKSNPVQSLVRGIKILEAISVAEDGLSLAAVAEAVELKPTTTHNLIKTLVGLGYLERKTNPTRYATGSSLTQLAKNTWDSDTLRSNISVAMLRLSETFPQATIVFTEVIGNQPQATLRIDHNRPGILIRNQYQLHFPYTTATGLCVLAYADQLTRQAIEAHFTYGEMGSGFWGEKENLEAFLTEARELGYTRVTQNTPYRMAVPVFDSGNNLRGALGMALYNDDITTAYMDSVCEALAKASESTKIEH